MLAPRLLAWVGGCLFALACAAKTEPDAFEFERSSEGATTTEAEPADATDSEMGEDAAVLHESATPAPTRDPFENIERPLCGGAADPINGDWCDGYSFVDVSIVDVVDANGDGRVSPDEDVVVTIRMQNDGAEHVNYPCTGMLADHPDVTVKGTLGMNPSLELYAVGPEMSSDQTMTAHIGRAVAPGSAIQFLVWLDSLNSGCTNGDETTFDLVVE